MIIRTRLKERRRYDRFELELKGGEVLRFIRSRPNGCALVKEIAENLGIPEDLVRYIARLLAKTGLIRRHWIKPSDVKGRRVLYCIYDSPYRPPEPGVTRDLYGGSGKQYPGVR